MSDQQDSSSSDNGLVIVLDSPSAFSGAQYADGSDTSQSSSTTETSDNKNEEARDKDSSREEKVPADEEHVRTPGENTPGTEGEKNVLDTRTKENIVITDEGEPSGEASAVAVGPRSSIDDDGKLNPGTANVLMKPAFMELIEKLLSKVKDNPSYEPSRDETWFNVGQELEMQVRMQEPPPLQYQAPPQHHQYPAPHQQPPQLHQERPSQRELTGIKVRAGPSWAEACDLDDMRRSPPMGGPGHHDLGRDLSRACELTQLASRRGPCSTNRNEYLRTSRFAPYDQRYRSTTGMAALRRSGIIQHGNELESQPSTLAYPAGYNIQQNPEIYDAIRPLSNVGITRDSSSQTFSLDLASQYTSQSPPVVYSPSSPPKLVPISAPRNTPRSSPQQTPRYSSQYTPFSPGTAPAKLFDVPSTSVVQQQPLDLSVVPRKLPSLLPLSQSSSSRRVVACAPLRATPTTQTVTSTTNTAVFTPYDLLPHIELVSEESNLSTNRIEPPTSSSEQFLNRPTTTHRAATPVDVLPEHQLIWTWPVDNLACTDHTEEVETIDCDLWLESLRSLDRTPAPAVPPPPIVILPPEPSTLSSVTTTTAPPPRTTSS